MSLLERVRPTELEIDDIIRSDQFPDDLKVYADAESWKGYHCERRKWEDFGICHWLFWSDNHESEPLLSDLKRISIMPIMEKIKSILVDVEGRGDFLVQYWENTDWRGDIPAGRGQPFGLNSTNIALYAYASMSRFHESDATSEQHSGLPNRAFKSRQAVCTTERRACPIPPRAAAVDCNITASLALPMHQGVLEIVTNSDRPTNEINEIFRHLASKYAAKDPMSGGCRHLYEHNDKKEKALEEIKKSLQEVRRIHDIPLSRTWIPCRICDALFRIHQVIKTLDISHLPHLRNWDSIKKGQCAVGRAFLSNKLEFCKVSRYGMKDYPSFSLANHYQATACFAVPLRRGSRSSSLNEEDDIYVVEFFLSEKYVKRGDWRTFVKSGAWRTTASSLLSTMRRHLKSVSIASGDEIGKHSSIDDHLEENGGETVGLDSSNQEKESLSIDENLEENGGKTIRLNSPNKGKENLSIDENLVESRGGMVQVNSPNQGKENLLIDKNFVENGGGTVRLDSSNQGKENLPIDDNFAENRSETVRLDSPNQEKEEGATAHVENNNKSNTKKTNMTIASSLQKVQHRKAGIPISLELLQQHFGMKLEAAADSIGVGRSTLKRACREYNIAWWPSRKRKNKDNCSIPEKTLQCTAEEKQIGETSEAPISNSSGKQCTETNIFIELHERDISSVTIKAKFGAEEFIKFKLPVASGMREFQHQVEKRLHWKDGTYSVRYLDDDNDLILVKIDEDLQEYICSSRAMGRNTVTVSLQPITNFPN